MVRRYEQTINCSGDFSEFYRAAGALSKGDRSCGRKIWLCPARAVHGARAVWGALAQNWGRGAPQKWVCRESRWTGESIPLSRIALRGCNSRLGCREHTGHAGFMGSTHPAFRAPEWSYTPLDAHKSLRAPTSRARLALVIMTLCGRNVFILILTFWIQIIVSGHIKIFCHRSLILFLERFEILKLVQWEINNSQNFIKSQDNSIYEGPGHSQPTTASCMIQKVSKNRAVALLPRFQPISRWFPPKFPNRKNEWNFGAHYRSRPV